MIIVCGHLSVGREITMEIKQKQVAFIPRRSPRFLDQKQKHEAVGADNDANKKLEMDRNIRYHIIRNLLTEAEKEKIREYKRIAYLKRRSTTASEGNGDQVA
ncbi:hypothetical protein MKX03_004186 [Papaver bracteatum]|nr:hypothetical protein MKX03_004186 [Papaver bracteatum]